MHRHKMGRAAMAPSTSPLIATPPPIAMAAEMAFIRVMIGVVTRVVTRRSERRSRGAM
jgi:hypothetical protein